MKRMIAFVLSLIMISCVVVMPGVAEEVVTYRTLYSGEITSLNYLTTATTSEFTVSANVIDTLVEYNRFGEVKPSLALTWEYDPANLTYTFHLRDNATWVTADGTYYADVVADDFVTAAKYLLNAENASSTANIFYSVIAGAKDYYLGNTTDFETVGVKALDKYTLQYTLIEPVPYFLSMVTYVCFMPVNADFLAEKGADFGVATSNENLLYCGAYRLETFKPQEKRVYAKNESNWDAENVFIERIEQTYNKEANTISPELFTRGEVDSATITSTIASEWLSDPEKADLICPVRQSNFYTYFWAFNFDPKFDAEYEPENWKIAVNNENFRQSLFWGLDRVKSKMVMDPDNPEALLFNTITPPEFVSVNGVDFTQIGGLAKYTNLGADFKDEEKALQYKAAAVEELTAAGATFPVKILMPYNSSSSSWAEECVIVEQQLENLLGTDYIDIIIDTRPSTSYLTNGRKAGKYALEKCNWGPDYADPNTFTDPFYNGTFNKPEYAVEYLDENGVSEYYKLVDAARAITDDLQARYEALAVAETFVLDNALVIPYGYNNGGYTASRLNPFEAQFAPFGISNDRYKGQTLLDAPMSTDQYWDAYDLWQEERAKLAEAAQ